MKVNKTELLNGIMIDYNINKTNGIKYVPMLPPLPIPLLPHHPSFKVFSCSKCPAVLLRLDRSLLDNCDPYDVQVVGVLDFHFQIAQT